VTSIALPKVKVGTNFMNTYELDLVMLGASKDFETISNLKKNKKKKPYLEPMVECSSPTTRGKDLSIHFRVDLQLYFSGLIMK